jgi:hypothetical protein
MRNVRRAVTEDSVWIEKVGADWLHRPSLSQVSCQWHLVLDFLRWEWVNCLRRLCLETIQSLVVTVIFKLLVGPSNEGHWELVACVREGRVWTLGLVACRVIGE